jgi:hypothetical protein
MHGQRVRRGITGKLGRGMKADAESGCRTAVLDRISEVLGKYERHLFAELCAKLGWAKAEESPIDVGSGADEAAHDDDSAGRRRSDFDFLTSSSMRANSF